MGKAVYAIAASLLILLFTITACHDDDTLSGSQDASVTSLACSSATFSASAVVGESYSATAEITYEGGNGQTYDAGDTITSTGVTGLSAVLVSGTLSDDSGTLTFQISGTPASSGTASFAIAFGDASCTLSLTVNASADADATVTALDCSSVELSDSPVSGETFSGTLTIPYEGGNGASYDAGTAISSTGVSGLTATLEAGTLASGAGELTYTVSGTAASSGTASFAITFADQSCTVEVAVAADSDTSSSDCDTLSSIDKVVCLAEAFKAQLSSSQLATVQLSYSVSNAKKWSNFPEAIYGNRVGLAFGDMTDTQIEYAKALLEAVTGTGENEGWDEITQNLNADDYLNENGGGSSYGTDNFYLAFLGTPATSGTFEIQFGGHHMAVANTYTDGELIGATPSFRGVEPFAAFTWDGATNQPLVQEKDALSAMLTGLSSTQLATAKLSGTYSDLVAGPQKDDNFPSTASGIACSELSDDQRALVLAAINTYVDDIDDDDAATILAKYEDELDDTYIAYSGTTSVTTKNDYVRIDGPSVWIEYSVQNGVVLSGTHPHSVWRDKTYDYGGND